MSTPDHRVDLNTPEAAQALLEESYIPDGEGFKPVLNQHQEAAMQIVQTAPSGLLRGNLAEGAILELEKHRREMLRTITPEQS